MAKDEEKKLPDVPEENMPEFPPEARPVPDAPQGNSDNPYENDVERIHGKPIEAQEQPAVNPEVPGSPDDADHDLAPADAEDDISVDEKNEANIAKAQKKEADKAPAKTSATKTTATKNTKK